MYVIRRTRPRDPERVQQEMEAVFRNLLSGGPTLAGGQPSPWRPATEVYETTDALVVRAEIAGMDEGNLTVNIDGDLLVIHGDRPDRCPDDRRSYHEARIPYGAFEPRFTFRSRLRRTRPSLSIRTDFFASFFRAASPARSCPGTATTLSGERESNSR